MGSEGGCALQLPLATKPAKNIEWIPSTGFDLTITI
jgi:hypothetical protein